MRSLLDRRQELVAWHEAVTINSPAAYREFLGELIRAATTLRPRNGWSAAPTAGRSAPTLALCKPTRMRRTDVAETRAPRFARQRGDATFSRGDAAV